MSEPERQADKAAARRRAAEAMARAAKAEGDDVDIVGVMTHIKPRDDMVRALVRAEGQLQLAKGHLANPFATDNGEDLEQAVEDADAALQAAKSAVPASASDNPAQQESDKAARRSVYGLQSAFWPMLDGGMLTTWQADRATVFGEIKCCGHCGEVQFGGRYQFSNFTVEAAEPPGAEPPYHKCNYVMSKYTMDSLGNWRVCPSCADAKHRAQRSRHVVAFNPTYIRLLIVPGIACLALQNLSLIDVSVS